MRSTLFYRSWQANLLDYKGNCTKTELTYMKRLSQNSYLFKSSSVLIQTGTFPFEGL